MNKLSLLLSLTLGAGLTAQAQNAVDCSYTPLSGNITTNTTLHANTLYRLEGCVKVTSGHTLTIEAGTRILAEKASNATLYIAPGAYILAQGTSTDPIVFSTDQIPGYKAVGDWGGLVIGGQAQNNVPTTGLIALTRNCSIAAGGSNDADSSGVLQYVQIHYAKYGLSMVSVGNKTVIDHIDVSEVSKNAYEFMGGSVNAKYLASLNAHQADFLATYGYRGNIQFGVASRKDPAAHDALKSDGILIQNDPSATSNTPYTRPVFSNMTILGPVHCNAGTLSSDFRDAVRFENYSKGSVYNSVMTGWKEYGFTISGSNAIANTAGNNLNFSNNSLSGNGGDYRAIGTWSSACEGSSSAWFEGLGSLPCDEAGNQLDGFGSTGYDASSICSSATPDFRLANTTALDIPDYSATELSNTFFDDAFTFRGAFDQSQNWISGWADFNAQQTDYCKPLQRIAKTDKQVAKPSQKVVVAPNPAVAVTYASFSSTQRGASTIQIIDKVSGKVLKSMKTNLAEGSQRIPLDIDGLQVGIYILRIETPDGKVQFSQIMVAN